MRRCGKIPTFAMIGAIITRRPSAENSETVLITFVKPGVFCRQYTLAKRSPGALKWQSKRTQRGTLRTPRANMARGVFYCLKFLSSHARAHARALCFALLTRPPGGRNPHGLPPRVALHKPRCARGGTQRAPGARHTTGTGCQAHNGHTTQPHGHAVGLHGLHYTSPVARAQRGLIVGVATRCVPSTIPRIASPHGGGRH